MHTPSRTRTLGGAALSTVGALALIGSIFAGPAGASGQTGAPGQSREPAATAQPTTAASADAGSGGGNSSQTPAADNSQAASSSEAGTTGGSSETAPGRTEAGGTESKPEPKASETTPSETTPSETKPSETKPSETKPSETKPTREPASSAAVTEDHDDADNTETPVRNNIADEGDNQHPSGRDRSVESGNSGNQGRAASDPDDDGRGPDRGTGGVDQPGGTGGADRDDQDGNNGCGNDDDFEDDNEGWCGRNPRRGGPASAPAEQAVEATGAEKPCPAGAMKDESAEGGRCVATGGSDVCVVTAEPAAAEAHMDEDCAAVVVVSGTSSPDSVERWVDAAATSVGLPVAATTAGTRTNGAPAAVEGTRAEVLSAAGEAAPKGTVSARSNGSGFLVELPGAVVGAAAAGVSGALAFTGANSSLLVVFALVAMTAGFALVVAGRRTV